MKISSTPVSTSVVVCGHVHAGDRPLAHAVFDTQQGTFLFGCGGSDCDRGKSTSMPLYKVLGIEPRLRTIDIITPGKEAVLLDDAWVVRRAN